jgi:hypothetical protein
MFEQYLPGFGGGGAAPIPYQQVLPQFDFEQAHLSAKGRLGYVECHGGAGKTAHFGHAHKIFKLFEVHGQILHTFELVMQF